MIPEPKPSKSPVEARTMLIGAPTPVESVATDAISKGVIAVIIEVSLIVEAVDLRLKSFASLSLVFISSRKNCSASSIFFEVNFDLYLVQVHLRYQGIFFRCKHWSFIISWFIVS